MQSPTQHHSAARSRANRRGELRRALQTFGCLLLVVFAARSASASPTDLDASFAANGIERRENSAQNQFDGVAALALQRDGKVVVVSECLRTASSPFTPNLCLHRLNATGSGDPSFAAAATVVTPLRENWYAPQLAHGARVALQSDGKIVIASTCESAATGNDFCLARYHGNGAIDASFGSAGVVTTSIAAGSGADVLNALAIDAIDRIVVAGGCAGVSTGTDFCLARYTAASGALDPSFGNAGKVLATFAPNLVLDEQANALVIARNGDITVAGQCARSASEIDLCLAQFTNTGVVKSSFGNAGVVYANPSGAGVSERAYAITLQFDGKLLVAGQCGSLACLSRYSASGVLDTSFDAAYARSGVVSIVVSGAISSAAMAVSVLPDGRILTLLSCNTATTYASVCLSRHWPEGFADTTFSPTGGALLATPLVIQNAADLLVQSDGRFLLATSCRDTTATMQDSCVLRLQGGPNTARQCSLDIDGDGVVRPDTDAMIFMRAMFGFDSSRMLQNIVVGSSATRSDWFSIRDYLVNQCGMSIRSQ